MPGSIDSYYVLAFNKDENGESAPEWKAVQVASRDDAAQRAQSLFETHDGAVAWRRHALTAIGELGEPEVILQLGAQGDFA